MSPAEAFKQASLPEILAIMRAALDAVEERLHDEPDDEGDTERDDHGGN